MNWYFLIWIFFIISIFGIFWAMIGYPTFVLILGKINKKNKNTRNYYYEPTVTILVVAHNEEKIIREKLDNLQQIEYPQSKLKILVSSDNSTDKTNAIVSEYSLQKNKFTVEYYLTQERKGKTNAQNEAMRKINSEITIFTDANSMLDSKAVKELVSSFSDDSIKYVCGRLVYRNNQQSLSSKDESNYWNLEVKIRDIESNIQTITAGNGALYAVRTVDYVDVDLIFSHDLAFPVHFALNGYRAINNNDALAFEKAGENDKDEYNRKVRMNRIILRMILPSFSLLNINKYKWFTIFYLGHRTSRYLLWLFHIILLISSLLLFRVSSIARLSSYTHAIVLIIVILTYLFGISNIYFRVVSNKLCKHDFKIVLGSPEIHRN